MEATLTQLAEKGLAPQVAHPPSFILCLAPRPLAVGPVLLLLGHAIQQARCSCIVVFARQSCLPITWGRGFFCHGLSSEDIETFCACVQVQPPRISMRDFEKVLLRARPTVSGKDLKVFEDFTKEFGEEG